MFRNVVQRNAGFAKRVAELEQELAVWKIAFGSADEERNTLKKKVTRLERSIGSLKVHAIVLIPSACADAEARTIIHWSFV